MSYDAINKQYDLRPSSESTLKSLRVLAAAYGRNDTEVIFVFFWPMRHAKLEYHSNPTLKRHLVKEKEKGIKRREPRMGITSRS